ncbi:MAG: methionine adenosyltransferase domain-containing protein [Bacteroidales bacterium]|nr:methionine adenosyltransferase domain-containing protein [Bacteroidales bacterium]
MRSILTHSASGCPHRLIYGFTGLRGTYRCYRDDGLIAEKVKELFDLRPAAIIDKFGLKNPIYEPTAAYGHFGKDPYVKDGIQFFGWEKLDAVDAIKKAFNI